MSESTTVELEEGGVMHGDSPCIELTLLPFCHFCLKMIFLPDLVYFLLLRAFRDLRPRFDVP